MIQTYASGAVPGSFQVTVPLAVERPLLFYPFDAYAADLVGRADAADSADSAGAVEGLFNLSNMLRVG
jgi:hypothetical protein